MSKDRFSQHSASYAAFRPSYPQALYDFLLANVSGRDRAWDVGCGNGQVAKDLAPFFRKVFATDISEKQVQNAVQLPNITYSVCPAEETPFPDHSFDLITVGQALHWFRLSAFFEEATRVAKPGALVAAWGYSLLSVGQPIDKEVNRFYTEVIGPYWDAERKLVDQHYQHIAFPFEEVAAPPLSFSFAWTLEQTEGYLTTWSAVQKYIAQNNVNPVVDLIEKIRPHWGSKPRTVSFPLFLRVGRVHKK